MKLQLRLVHLMKTLRGKQQWTQKEFASELGSSISHVERLESRSSSENALINSILEIQKYAKMMDMTAADFVGYIEGNEPLQEDPLFSKVFKKFQSLDLEQQVKVLRLFEKNGLEKLERSLEILDQAELIKKSQNGTSVSTALQLFAEAVK